MSCMVAPPPKEPFLISRKRVAPQSVSLIKRQKIMTPEQMRLQQVATIYEGCFAVYFMDGAFEKPIMVPYLIMEACTYLERVCPGGQKDAPNLQHRDLAAACLLLAIQFHTESMAQFTLESFVRCFRIRDSNLTTAKLVRAQKWVLQKLNHELWCGPEQRKQGRAPFFEQDKGLDNRSLTELGFLAEQSLYPASMQKNKIHDIDEITKFFNQNEGYRFLRQRLRFFCGDIDRFRETNFKWSLEPINGA